MNFDEFLNLLSRAAVLYGGRLLVACVVLLVGWLVAGWVARLSRNGLQRARVDPTLAGFLTNFNRWVVLLLVVLGCLSIFGVETTSFAAVIGSAGIAIGLALQGTLSNCASGVLLLIVRPFKVGDTIVVAGKTGTVREVGMIATLLDTADNRRFIIPNSQVFGSPIENNTHHGRRRADVDFGVAYSADIDQTREVLTGVARGVNGGLADPPPEVWLQDLGAAAVQWSVRVWAPTASFGAVRQALVRDVKRALAEAEISMAAQPLDVRLKRGA